MAQVKYRGTSFEDWYKANYGTAYDKSKGGISQTAGMADADYEIGQQLYNAYLKDLVQYYYIYGKES